MSLDTNFLVLKHLFYPPNFDLAKTGSNTHPLDTFKYSLY